MTLTASEPVRSVVAIPAGFVTQEGSSLFLGSGILYGPAMVANAGGVAVSGLEAAEDGQRLQRSREEAG